MFHLSRKMIVIGLVAGTLGISTGAADAAELKIAHWMSPNHPMDRFVMSPWAAEVSKKSGGSLLAKVYPGGALGKGPVAQFKRAVDGIADVSFGLPGFTSKLFPGTGLIELPGMATNAVRAVDKLWNALPLLQDEWKRVKVLALWTNETQVLMTRDKPIRSMADIEGMKIRVPSATQGETIKVLGGVPVFMPINRVYSAMSTGVIDGVMTGPSTVKSFKFDEVTKYHTIGLPIGRSPFFLVMNLKKWESLTPDQQKLIEATSGRALSTKGSAFYMKAGAAGIKTVSGSKKHEVIRFADAELARVKKILAAHREKFIADAEKSGLNARAIVKAMNPDS